MLDDSRFCGTPVVGTLSTFDRIIIKGHLPTLQYTKGVLAFLWVARLLLKNWQGIVRGWTMEIRSHLQEFAEKHGIPIEPLHGSCTWASGCSKESLARRIADERQIEQGPVCVFSAVEPCASFDVRGNPTTRKLEPQRRRRTCLHFYLYLIDHEFGWMHIRLQSWFPFAIQIYVNGREWLCRALEREDIGYLRSDNKITAVTNLKRAQALAERLHHKQWVPTLNALARRVNPLLPM